MGTAPDDQLLKSQEATFLIPKMEIIMLAPLTEPLRTHSAEGTQRQLPPSGDAEWH